MKRLMHGITELLQPSDWRDWLKLLGVCFLSGGLVIIVMLVVIAEVDYDRLPYTSSLWLLCGAILGVAIGALLIAITVSAEHDEEIKRGLKGYEA